MNFRQITLVTLLASSFAAAQADTLVYTSATLPVDYTDWTSFASLQKFDPAQGALQKVTLELFADLAGSAKAENKSPTASTITLNLQATLSLANPDSPSTMLVQTTPLVSSVFQASGFDGAVDYAGSSGRAFLQLSASSSSQAIFTAVNHPATLGLFTGTGDVLLPFAAVGESAVVASGNYRGGFTTLAGGHARVTYDYLPTAVPEPETWALMLAGIAAIGSIAARRSRQA